MVLALGSFGLGLEGDSAGWIVVGTLFIWVANVLAGLGLVVLVRYEL